MADNEKSVWERLLSEISSPWDWAAAALGASLGAGGTLLAHGADLGTSVAAGATAGIAVKKAATASASRWQLKRRARAMIALIGGLPVLTPEIGNILSAISFELKLFDNRVITNGEFEDRLNGLVTAMRASLATKFTYNVP